MQAKLRPSVAAVADALGLSKADVMLYPLGAVGSFGRRFDHDAAVQAALIAREIQQAGYRCSIPGSKT